MNTAPKELFDKAITNPINTKIEKYIYINGGSIREAALRILSVSPNWYVQTPEGEYLDYLRNKKN
jgi:hypothetical protein